MKKIICFFLSLLIFLYCVGCNQKNLSSDNIHNNTESPKNDLDILCDITIIIDAGHGGEDGGTVGVNGVYEKDLNLAVSLLLHMMLQEKGYNTIMTRSDDALLYDRDVNYEGQKKLLDFKARLAIAEKEEKAIFVSIHMNSFSQSKYKGLQVYYSKNSPASKLLAEEIQLNGRLLLDASNNRLPKLADGNILLLDRINHPAVLVECGFLSNPKECERLSTDAYQKEVAESICLSIINYLNTNTTQKNKNNVSSY